MSTERLAQSSDRIKETRRVALETEDLGTSILQDLHNQRQSLLHAHNSVCFYLALFSFADLNRFTSGSDAKINFLEHKSKIQTKLLCFIVFIIYWKKKRVGVGFSLLATKYNKVGNSVIKNKNIRRSNLICMNFSISRVQLVLDEVWLTGTMSDSY